ncbi:HlyD family secretion protein [Rhodoblastus acidophilus]|uniref:efflux RND transporter periplasmic adaptor subunit n=1 Tax=Rhodoblastus acidophilus TaxID=1074 RepID=UPI002224A15D|nr:efflux RND transporter periplasmic adaptor subunit [Rhodoblastus acidophilus]MCW2316968.1 HlyD family secretion protein [Rhodoblastus acidophilus]
MKPRVIVIVVILALLAGGGWWWSRRGPAEGPLVLQGNVEVRQVNLGFKVAGRIAQLLVDEGDHVVAGQKLAALDKIYFEDTLRQLRAQRDQSAANLAKMIAGNRPEEIAQAEALVSEREATLANMKLTAERAQKLFTTAAGTQKTYDDATMAARQAEAQRESARQALNLMKAGFRKEDIDLARGQLAEREAAIGIAERQLADADLIAPGPGIVLSRVREAGAIVNGGETVFIVSLTTPVWVRTYVSELELGRIKPGQPVDLRLDAPQAKPMMGRIGFISTTAEFTPKTVETRELRTALVYRVRIVADDPDGVLRQGMPVTATVNAAGPDGPRLSESARP